VRERGRRRRRSQTPSCKGMDRVKVRQGNVLEKRSKWMKGGKQMSVGLSYWCASPWATTNLPFVSTGTDLESAVR